jgi:hypothetical protein
VSARSKLVVVSPRLRTSRSPGNYRPRLEPIPGGQPPRPVAGSSPKESVSIRSWAVGPSGCNGVGLPVGRVPPGQENGPSSSGDPGATTVPNDSAMKGSRRPPDREALPMRVLWCLSHGVLLLSLPPRSLTSGGLWPGHRRRPQRGRCCHPVPDMSPVGDWQRTSALVGGGTTPPVFRGTTPGPRD